MISWWRNSTIFKVLNLVPLPESIRKAIWFLVVIKTPVSKLVLFADSVGRVNDLFVELRDFC
jgi:hypothetical protein